MSITHKTNLPMDRDGLSLPRNTYASNLEYAPDNLFQQQRLSCFSTFISRRKTKPQLVDLESRPPALETLPVKTKKCKVKRHRNKKYQIELMHEREPVQESEAILPKDIDQSISNRDHHEPRIVGSASMTTLNQTNHLFGESRQRSRQHLSVLSTNRHVKGDHLY